MKKTLLLVFLFLGAQTLTSQNNLEELLSKYNSGDVPYISVQELRMFQLNEEVMILDAREPEEFKVSHIEKAVEIGYSNFDISTVKDIPKDKKIVVYCSLGIRSEDIGKKLLNEGFTNVENLYGGIFEWSNNGLPLIDSNGAETEKVHAFSRKWSRWLIKGEKIY